MHNVPPGQANGRKFVILSEAKNLLTKPSKQILRVERHADSVPADSQDDNYTTLASVGFSRHRALLAVGFNRRQSAGSSPAGVEQNVMPDRRSVYRDLLALPTDQVPLDPRTEGVFEGDGLVIERVGFAVNATERAPAHFARPANAVGPLPGVVALHCHGGFYVYGKEKVIPALVEPPSLLAYTEELYAGRSYGVELARQGFCVLTIDCRYFGERRRDDLVTPDLWEKIESAGGTGSVAGARFLNFRLSAGEHEAQREILANGQIWPGLMLADDMRSVDYLLTRPEVDPERIGCIGLSLGGFRSALLAGMDERIQAAVVIGWMTDFADLEPVHRNRHSWMVYVPRLTEYGDLTGITTLHAPKPLLVMQCAQDPLFPLAGMKQACQRLAHAYEAAGARDAFEAHFYDCPHEFNTQMQDDAFAWLATHLSEER